MERAVQGTLSKIAPYTGKEHDGRTARGCSHIGGVASGIGLSGA